MNNIGDDCAKVLTTALRANKSLTTLNLTGNGISDDVALALVKMMVKKYLTDISMLTNKMSEDIKRMANILGTNVSLTTLNLVCLHIGEISALAFLDMLATTPRRKRKRDKYLTRLMDTRIHPLPGGHEMRLECGALKYWPKPCEMKENYCKFRRWTFCSSKICRGYKHSMHCADCDANLYTWYCYQTYNEVRDLVGTKANIRKELEANMSKNNSNLPINTSKELILS